MPSLELQVVDIFSCIDNKITEELDHISHDDDTDPSKNLYAFKNQQVLSGRNGQLIKIFGRTESDQSICVNVTGFLPYFYIGFQQDITKSEANAVVGFLTRKANKRYQKHLVDWELIYRQPYEQFVGKDQFPFIKMYFKNRFAFKEFEKVAMREQSVQIFKSRIPFYIGESNLDEILRFTHQSDIKPSSWIKVTDYKPRIRKSSHVKLEVDCNISQIKPVDKIANSRFKIMIYDIECQSQLGELGDFPVAKKNYQKLARELLDLVSTHAKHPLVRDDSTFHQVLETCLRLVFTPGFYAYGIRQVKTVDNLKPLPELIRQTVDTVVYQYRNCANKMKCVECYTQLSEILAGSFPPTSDPIAYFELARQIWVNLTNITRYNYNRHDSWDELEKPVNTMLQLAFEDYYDGFNFSPVNIKGRNRPEIEQLCILTPTIANIVRDKSKDYETRLNDLTKFIDQHLAPAIPQGDPVIQIGFTFQRLGEPHPYLKGIYTVDTCQSFTNEELIYDENDTELTQAETERYREQALERDGVTVNARQDLVKWLSRDQLAQDHSQVLIRSFTNESAMIKNFAILVNSEDPDMIGGYNSFGFDDRYLFNRVEELGIRDKFLGLLSRLRHDMASLREPAGASRNKEDQKGKKKMETHYIDMTGRITFDIYRILANDPTKNLPEYKLNYVCRHFLKKQKNDVPPTQIPILQRGTAADRSLVARYCIIDCVLCNRLIAKLSIINNLIAMSNVALVPMKYLLFRGQTIKGLSLIVKKCSHRGKIVKTLREHEKTTDADKYEGAIVLDPLIDIYSTPVSVADFNSLYPSSMISENISNDTLVCDPKYDNLAGFHYNTVSYDEFILQHAKHKKTGATLKRKEKIKKPDMRVCRYVGNQKGILPEIEEELIASRKAAKRKMAEYEKAGDTAMAAAWDCQQLAYKVTCNSIYGITGAPVSPIYNKDIAASITATGRKMIVFSKNYVEQNYVDLPIRLKDANITSRDIVVKNTTCVYGDSVAEYTPILVRRHGETSYIEIQNLAHRSHYSMYSNGKELAFLEDCEIWSDQGWTRIKHVVRHKTTKPMYRVVTGGGLVDVTEDHSLLDVSSNPVKPVDSLDKGLLTRQHPVLTGHPDTTNGPVDTPVTMTARSQLSAAFMYMHCRRWGCQLVDIASESGTYKLRMDSENARINTNVVKQVVRLPDNEHYVYDIETENHHFSAGIGDLVVHNTDSVFIKFDMVDGHTGLPLSENDAIFASMELCGRSAREISLQLKTPQNLEFEKTIKPFLLINKKMYKGHYYTKMNNPSYYVNTMGFATKKRDSAPIAKLVVDGLTDLLFSIDPQKLDQSVVRNYLCDKFRKILKGEYPMELFIRTKSWKGHYANPEGIAQHVLAVRQAIRDPGNQFQVNDRIPFIHIVNPKATIQGDKIETVEFVTQNKLPIDYRYYIEKQLVNPLLKILSPNRRLGITEKWLLGILDNLTKEQTHTATMDKFFTIIPKGGSMPP